MKIHVSVETPLSDSIRAAQVSSMFDVPPADRAHLEWSGEAPIESQPWHIGLIVGPSGAGKSTLLREMFGAPADYAWDAASVIDDFPRIHTVNDIAEICQAVGFNTIPAWLRPYRVLSNGEKFRVDLARRLLTTDPDVPIACDEFTSVVDRHVAKIGAHAVQKFIRRHARQFVAATCHYDLEEWLQPDWVLEPATMSFRWRDRSQRPGIDCSIHAAAHESWHTFARFHYLTNELHRAAECFVLAVDGAPAAFCAGLFRPHPTAKDIIGVPRLVTLPDYQGLGLAFALVDRVAACYRTAGWRCRTYPAHPALVRSFDKSPLWGSVTPAGMRNSTRRSGTSSMPKPLGGRPCAVFEYIGPSASADDTVRLMPQRMRRH